MTLPFSESFKQNYQSHLQHLKLKVWKPDDNFSDGVQADGSRTEKMVQAEGL